MTATPLVNQILRDHHGTTVIEFAMVAPVVLTLLVGSLYVSLLLFSKSALEYAVQEGARCASAETPPCTSSSIQSYAAGKYSGIGTPTFVLTTASCGNKVSGTITVSWSTGLTAYSTPLSASACFPSS